uniref:ATP-dependent DNA helicase n=1 Tax=Amphimedon queenslandica TaxID=400682 RepID=A0A1X7TEG3_AMPQE
MLIYECVSQLQPDVYLSQDYDWLAEAQLYLNIEEAASFIAQEKQRTTPTPFTTTATPDHLQGRQRDVYDTIKVHFEQGDDDPLHIIVNGTAGTSKSYLVNCLRLLLGTSLKVAAPTGVAAFIIEGRTLHSLLHIPERGDFKDMEGINLQNIQEELSNIKYLIDKLSMVSRKTFGMIDRRLRQAFPHKSQVLFGWCSVLLFGDFG